MSKKPGAISPAIHSHLGDTHTHTHLHLSDDVKGQMSGGDMKPTKVVPVLGLYLFKVLHFGYSCLPTTAVFHNTYGN